MKVREDSVLSPAGSETIYGHLETPRATGVLAVTAQDEVILIGQHRYPVGEYTWEIIEGAADEHELPSDAARRELREEAGIEAAALVPLGHPFHLANSRSNEEAHLFLATELLFGESSPDETEVLEVVKVPLQEAYRRIDEGEIRDVMTIVALHRYRDMFQR